MTSYGMRNIPHFTVLICPLTPIFNADFYYYVASPYFVFVYWSMICVCIHIVAACNMDILYHVFPQTVLLFMWDRESKIK